MKAKRIAHPYRFNLFPQPAYPLGLRSHPLLASFIRIKIPSPSKNPKT